MLLPSLLVVLALLLQPVCLAYTRTVMCAAAGECARAALTAYGSDLGSCRAYALRRLEAVPEVSLFHVGGQADWQVAVSSSGNQVSVRVAGHARPLPLFGALASALGKHDGTGLLLEVSLDERMRPSWLGGGYDAWQTIWG